MSDFHLQKQRKKFDLADLKDLAFLPHHLGFNSFGVGSMGSARERALSLSVHFFSISCSFLGKNGQNNRLGPTFEFGTSTISRKARFKDVKENNRNSTMHTHFKANCCLKVHNEHLKLASPISGEGLGNSGSATVSIDSTQKSPLSMISLIQDDSFADHLTYCWTLLSVDSTQTSPRSVTSLTLIGSVQDPSPRWSERLQNNHNVRIHVNYQNVENLKHENQTKWRIYIVKFCTPGPV